MQKRNQMWINLINQQLILTNIAGIFKTRVEEIRLEEKKKNSILKIQKILRHQLLCMGPTESFRLAMQAKLAFTLIGFVK